MFVKICGITNRDDALAAVDAGAGALGFIFCKSSPRSVTPESLSEWIGGLPPDIRKVGIWVDEFPDVIEDISQSLGLSVAQLHGQETRTQFPMNIPVWKAVRVLPGMVTVPDYPYAEAILLDGPGSGKSFDWTLAASVARPVILAGGLTPENVQSAVRAANPWGVDTASGVEASPGRKDHARMKQFIKAALNS